MTAANTRMFDLILQQADGYIEMYSDQLDHFVNIGIANLDDHEMNLLVKSRNEINAYKKFKEDFALGKTSPEINRMMDDCVNLELDIEFGNMPILLKREEEYLLNIPNENTMMFMILQKTSEIIAKNTNDLRDIMANGVENLSDGQMDMVNQLRKETIKLKKFKEDFREGKLNPETHSMTSDIVSFCLADEFAELDRVKQEKLVVNENNVLQVEEEIA